MCTKRTFRGKQRTLVFYISCGMKNSGISGGVLWRTLLLIKNLVFHGEHGEPSGKTVFKQEMSVFCESVLSENLSALSRTAYT